MGKQSARLYYQGKDHKDIYFQGHYHTAMYKGGEIVWEKLYENTYIEDGKYFVDIDSRTASAVSEPEKHVMYRTGGTRYNQTFFFSNNIVANLWGPPVYYSENLKQVFKKMSTEPLSAAVPVGTCSILGNIFFRTNYSYGEEKVDITKFAKENGVWQLSQDKVMIDRHIAVDSQKSGYTVSDKIFLATYQYKQLNLGERYPNETYHYITTVDAEGNVENNLACIEHHETEHEVEYTRIITSGPPSIAGVFQNKCISNRIGGYDILSPNSLLNTIDTDIDVLYGFVMKITDNYIDFWGGNSTGEYIVRFDGKNLTMTKFSEIEVPLYENGKKIGTKKVVNPKFDSSFSSNNAYYTKSGFKFDCVHWKQKEEDSNFYLYFIKDFLGSDENFCIKISN